MISILLLTAACGGGTIKADLAMPGPGGVTHGTDGSMTMRAGIIVDAGDGSGVCERIRVSVYTSASAPGDVTKAPASAPIASGRGIGTYQADTYRCHALVVNLPPRDDYWLIVDYPVGSAGDPPRQYYTTGRPTVTTPTLRTGFYPVRVADKQTTQLVGQLGAAATPVPGI